MVRRTVLSNQASGDPEKLAAQVLLRRAGSAPPVDIVAIARSWQDLTLVEESLDGEGFYIDFGRMGGEIVLNANRRLERKRFTLAHELGHWVLARGGQGGFGTIALERPWCAETEKWCDRFAAALLMPRELMLDYLGSEITRGLLQRVQDGASRFQVSGEAFRNRIAEVYDAEVCRVWKQDDGSAWHASYHLRHATKGLMVKAMERAGILGALDRGVGVSTEVTIGGLTLQLEACVFQEQQLEQRREAVIAGKIERRERTSRASAVVDMK